MQNGLHTDIGSKQSGLIFLDQSFYLKCFFLTTPFGFSLVQRLSDFQSNKLVSRFSSAEEVHFVINSEICSLFG